MPDNPAPGVGPRFRWRLGTMGYAYPGWSGSFFPRGLPQSKWLEHYGRCFDSVELNTTFHALPAADRLRKWAASVPEGFRFAVKVGRDITHDASAEQMVPRLAHFCSAMHALGDRLGCLLLQFPPSFHVDRRHDLERLLQVIPDSQRCVIEFRSATWLRDNVRDLLVRHQAGFVALDHVDHPALAVAQPTGPILYVRLVGKHGQFDTEDHERFDPTPALQKWWDRLQQADLSHVDELWVTFNNDYAGHAPATLRRFARLAGVPLPAGPPQQKSLFD